MNRAIIFITGFTQDLGVRTGLEMLWEKVHEIYATPRCCVPPPYRWKHRPKHIASFIRRNIDLEGRIDVICYSYGGGVWFPKFNDEIRGTRQLHTVNLIDPVPRFRPLNWLGMKVPVYDVKAAHAHYQTRDVPRSPRCKFIRCGDHVEHLMDPAVGHSDIDNHEKVHKSVLESLRNG
jgi:hypothetical protein